jgi:hypothetical protein
MSKAKFDFQTSQILETCEVLRHNHKALPASFFISANSYKLILAVNCQIW